MNASPLHLYWDTCVFVRFITGKPEDTYLPQIRTHVSDAMKGSTVIHFSTIAMAEIRPQFFRGSKFGRIEEFFEEFQAAFYPIDPTPDILIKAGQVRDHQYHNPAVGPPSEKNKEYKRTLGTADAIHLITCLHLRDERKLSGIKFQTFDNGKGKTWEGKCVPLLTYEQWTQGITDPLVARICSLQREEPMHPQPSLLPLKN